MIDTVNQRLCLTNFTATLCQDWEILAIDSTHSEEVAAPNMTLGCRRVRPELLKVRNAQAALEV